MGVKPLWGMPLFGGNVPIRYSRGQGVEDLSEMLRNYKDLSKLF